MLLPDGNYRLERRSGLLPPLGWLRKRVAGRSGATLLLGVVPLPFGLEQGPRGPRLRYRGPLALLVDELEPEGDGAWVGRATLAGVTYGRFAMRLERPPQAASSDGSAPPASASTSSAADG